jgi:hypothetical protein
MQQAADGATSNYGSLCRCASPELVSQGPMHKVMFQRVHSQAGLRQMCTSASGGGSSSSSCAVASSERRQCSGGRAGDGGRDIASSPRISAAVAAGAGACPACRHA